MSETSDRYRRLAGRFTDVVAAVPDQGWVAPSPCQGWSAGDVLDHVVDSEHQFLRRVGGAPELVPGATHLARWCLVRDAVQAGLEDPDVADAVTAGGFGELTLAAAVDGFLCADLVVHAWDIARATGLPELEAVPVDEVERVHAFLVGLGDMVRTSGAFGPEVPAPAGATAQERLLAFLGRQP
ncbi:MAG TPA: TIGR03086 family metal-binding protein [Acidimicrobiales bacterium]|nr:TIGR03086 family metal-binding protein [Acidimicrobiales bacterium]